MWVINLFVTCFVPRHQFPISQNAKAKKSVFSDTKSLKRHHLSILTMIVYWRERGRPLHTDEMKNRQNQTSISHAFTGRQTIEEWGVWWSRVTLLTSFFNLRDLTNGKGLMRVKTCRIGWGVLLLFKVFYFWSFYVESTFIVLYHLAVAFQEKGHSLNLQRFTSLLS